MKSSRSIVAAIFAVLVIAGCEQQGGGSATATLSTSADSLSYALGYLYGNSLHEQGYDALNNNDYEAGFYEGLRGDDAPFSDQEMITMINTKREELRLATLSKIKAEGEAYLAENRTKEGVVETESGLQYRVIKEGTGKSPAATDVVSVHYEGQLLDGTYFDTSREDIAKANEAIYNPQRPYGPAEFRLDGVIRGWTEGVQLMKEGAVYEFCIPSELAYGERGAGNLIKPGATLLFKVELLEVK